MFSFHLLVEMFGFDCPGCGLFQSTLFCVYGVVLF
ncbi:DUF2752 domain-containing protein [Canibacter sp. lx-72]|nr:DUF2752 domain-containing protein [Canibacter zhuwentaonis]MBT1018809.1 DUF2752 domain-containing protein [Canibacter zhuwentaonis]